MVELIRLKILETVIERLIAQGVNITLYGYFVSVTGIKVNTYIIQNEYIKGIEWAFY